MQNNLEFSSLPNTARNFIERGEGIIDSNHNLSLRKSI
jgi:hypothetical protein